MNNCVVKNKEFYSLAEEGKIDGNELELIVHKYWNEVGKEDSFPPLSYIDEQLGIGKTYFEEGLSVIKLWERDYSKPIKFRSEYEKTNAVNKAKQFFPSEAIFTYKDNKGDFVLRVAKPINESVVQKELNSTKEQDIKEATLNSRDKEAFPDEVIISRKSMNIKDYVEIGDVRIGKYESSEGNQAIIAYKGNGENPDGYVKLERVTKIGMSTKATINGKTKMIPGKKRSFWTSILYANDSKSFKETVEAALSQIPIGDEFSESISLSEDGIKSLFNQTNFGFDFVKNEDGTIATETVKLSDNNIGDKSFTKLKNLSEAEESALKNRIEKLYSQYGISPEFTKTNSGMYTIKFPRLVKTVESKNQSVVRASKQGQEAVNSSVQNFIDSIDKTSEYGKALQEFINDFGLPAVQEVIFNITKANTHKSSWNNFRRALTLGFAEMASSEEKAAVTLHELIHSKTASLATLYESKHGIKHLSLNDYTLNTEVEAAFDSLVECKKAVLKYLSDNPDIKKALLETDVTDNLNKRPLYALLQETNPYQVQEFISEAYTNPMFIKLLQTIPSEEIQTGSPKSKIRTLWDNFVDAIKKVFGKNKAYTSILDKARENAELIMRVGNNVEAAFSTISEDVTSLSSSEQRAQLSNYYTKVNSKTLEEFNQDKAFFNNLIKNITETANESAGIDFTEVENLVYRKINKAIRDNNIDTDMIKSVYGYRPAGSSTAWARVTFNDYGSYIALKEKAANQYVRSLDNSEIFSEVLRLSSENEMFDSTFTFEDGETINTPFELNDQQKNALQKIDNFAKDRTKTAITLSGYAGTGKTSLMEMVAQKLRRRNNVVFSATTHQAAGVLKSKVSKYGFNAQTVNSLFGIMVSTDLEGTKYDTSKKARTNSEDKLEYRDIVIIDESSMLDDNNYKDVIDIARSKGAKIIFVGDKAQLAPVGQEEISKVFKNPNGEVVELTKVERTGDNAILSEATAIRDGKNFTYESSFNENGQGVAYVTPQNTSTINSIIESYTQGLKSDPNFFRILAFTNNSVMSYNNKVRQSLGYNGLPPQVGEPMLGYNNWGYDKNQARSGEPYKFVNSRSYKIISTKDSYKDVLRLSDGTECIFDIIPLTLEDSMGGRVTVPFIDIKNNVNNRNSAKLAAQEKAALWQKWRNTPRGTQRNIIQDTINEIERFLFVNDVIVGDQNNRLQDKVIDFGYAHTIHKSQGSTYTHVIMDDVGIESSKNSAERKQQLKYVGISRATDTVTIISSKVKKEGSPIGAGSKVGPKEINNSNVAPSRPVNQSTPSINIWHSSNENAHLSNFAIRPFTHTWNNGKTTKFQSVEQAFQFAKAMLFKDRTAARAILNHTTGTTLKDLGLNVKEFDSAMWEQHKESFMKTFIKESFMQNPDALKKLLDTGDATLTHNQDKGFWGKRFPEILMQVRDELTGYTASTESDLVRGIVEQFSGYFEGGGVYITDHYPGVSKELARKLEDHILGDGEFTEADAKRFLKEIEKSSERTTEESLNINNISSKSESFGVTIDTNLKQNWEEWQSNNPNGIVAYRVHFNKYNTVEEANNGRIGNPFSETTRGKDTVQQFYEWLITGNNFGNYKATEEYRQAIINKLLNTGTPNILYYKELNRPSHATVLGYLIENKKLLKNSIIESREQPSPTSTTLQDPRIKLAENTPSVRATTDMLPPISSTDIDLNTPINQIPDPNPDGLLKEYTLHSGGAIGADFAWGNIGASYGVSGKHYYDSNDARPNKRPPYANSPITAEDVTIGERKAFYAGKQMGRLSDKARKVTDPLLIRDWTQVSNSDMVVAIAKKFNMPGDRFSNNTKDDRVAHIQQVSGGTGWAVQMAISEGKPVYVFNQADGKWYMNFMGVWKQTEAPVLTPNFAGIGTREINSLGEKAIRECYEKTVAALNESLSQSTIETETQGSEKSFDINSLSPEMQIEFERLTKRSTQINNILSSEVMTATEAREIADSLMNLISDYITEVINDPALNDSNLKEQNQDAYLKNLLVNKNFEGVLTPFNPQGLSRKDIINKIGIDNIVNIFLKNKLSSNANVTPRQRKKMKVFAENLDAVLYLGANTLSINEGIHLVSNVVKGKDIKSVEDGIFINPDLNSARDLESIQENEGSLQEKWQIDSKTIDTIESMSQLVRNELFKLYQLDSEGNKITNSIGINKRIPVQESTKQLLNWLQGSLTLSDMVAKLKTKELENPWVKQLVELLEVTKDNAGKNTNFQNGFFSVFNKHLQSYSATTITYDKDGNQHIKRIPLNEKPFLKETIKQIKIDISLGTHPMFRPDGIDKTAFATFKTVLDNLFKIRDNHIAKQGFNKMLDQDRQITFEAISQAASLLGYPVDAASLKNLLNGGEVTRMIASLNNIYEDILNNINNKDYDPLTFKRGELGKKGSGIRGSLTKFLEPLTKHLQDIAISSIYDSGKMYQSYITPSYMTKLALKFQEKDPLKFEQFINEEYGQYDWFRDTSNKDKNSGWKGGWIGILAKDSKARKVFKHEVKLNYNKHNYMKDMTGNEYIMSLLSSFFSEGAGVGIGETVAWYRIPILSNKPSEEYIRFYADMGAHYQDTIAEKMAKVFNQELSRIQTVRMQDFKDIDPRFITNFSVNGKKFCFLDFMNVYLEGGEKANTTLGKLLNKKLNSPSWDVAKEPELMSLVQEAIKKNMQDKVRDIIKEYEKRGIIELAENIEGIKQGFGKDNIIENIERFLWNDTYAATQILQLTITDMAFYSNMEDLQKRIAQIHSPGIRGNAEAVDYSGNRVSDGFERTMYLADFKKVKSNIIDNLKIVFDRKLNALKNKSLDEFFDGKIKTEEDIKKAQEAKDHRIMIQQELHNNIIKQFEDINVTDAQAYSCPTSYRKKMLIFGKWSKEAENVYQKLLVGNYDYHQLNVTFQPLKPFVYSQISKPTGLEKGPMKNLKVPVQNKNSEYLLIMADAILQGEDTGQPNLLRAIYEVMEESAKVDNTKGIDTIQFGSTVKSGLMGQVDINRVLTGGKWNELIEVKDPNTGKAVKRTRGEVAAKALMQHNLYTKNTDGVVTGYNSTFVHEIPFEDYCLQQEVPIHFRDHSQQHGSQIRMITPSDLLSIDMYGNPVTYKVEGRDLSAKEFRTEYENTIAENIQQSIEDIYKELHLDAANKVEKNIILSRLLQNEILSSPRYGLDMYLACSLNPNTGEFRIPLGDPIQANRIEQLLNSIIKKRVNEQKIAGGPVVQVSNFGTSRRLNIRFKDKNGGLLKTREEFTKDWKPAEIIQNTAQNQTKLAQKIMKEEKLSYTAALKEAKNRLESPTTTTNVDDAYAEYIRANQGGIDHFEVFAPIFNEEIFTRFANPDGTIDISTMEKICPEALQMIGYRIPTEDKYSCAPIKIVGFLPREAGEGIMLPYDITLITGSDFDVDKEYLMRKKIHINLKSFKEQYENLEPFFLEEKRKESNLSREFTPQELKQYKHELTDMIDMFRSNEEKRNYIREAGTSIIERKMWDKFKETGYNIVKSNSGKEYRDNKIFDMTWEVLSHETTVDKLLNPGGFEEQKKQAYLIEAYRNTDKSWEELEAMSTKDLKDLSYSTKNLIFLDSQVQFYEQNNAASTILGMFAVQKIGHATLESNGYAVNIQEVCGVSEPFTILGKRFDGVMEFDKMLDDEGNVIGKTLGSDVAAAADAAKEPCMNLLNINSHTANVYSTLVRLGMPSRHASLLLSQPIITELLERYNKVNLTDYASLDTIINDYIQEFRKEGNMYDSAIEHEEITEKELKSNLRENRPETNYKVAMAFSKIQNIAYAIKGPTFLTRYNSISNAVGPLITDNIVTDFKSKYSTTGLYDRNGNKLTPEIIFSDHPVLKKFYDAYKVADVIFEDFPTKSEAFSQMITYIPSALQDKFLNDRSLLNDLKDFFLSHIIIDNNVVNENRAPYYIKEYAKTFLDIKNKNLDNKFIQNIKIKLNEKTKEYSLELPTSGLQQTEKDELSTSWYELYKKNKNVAMDLFNYNFFMGGIGFNPKTFMNLLPLQMREAIPEYKESFTNIPVDSAEYIVEQFLAHNTSSYKLFPIKEVSNKTIIGGILVIPEKEMSSYSNTPSFRMKDNNNKMRYFLLDRIADDGLVYKEIIPLGDNGSYLEMNSNRTNKTPIRSLYNTNTQARNQEATKQSEITSNSNQPIEDSNKGIVTPTPAQEKATAEKIIQGMVGRYPGAINESMAKGTLLKIKEGVIDVNNPVVHKYLSASMEAQGLTLDIKELQKILETFC